MSRIAFMDRRGRVAGVTSCAVAIGFTLDTLLQGGTAGLFNDFYDYWAGARLLAYGGNPYDTGAVNALLEHAGVHATVGSFGYSYPLLFALLMRPFALLPAVAAALAFTALSLLALGLAVALLVSQARPRSMAEAILLGAAAGGFVPVRGSLFFGQANLLVLLALALAARGVARRAMLAWTASVKLFPAAALLVFAVRGRRELGHLVTGIAGSAALILLPNLVLGGMRRAAGLAGMLAPDPFWTNQSLNGWISRLAMRSDSTEPPLPWLPVTPLVLVIAAVFAVAVLLVVRRAHGEPWGGALALLVCFGVVVAPKNSLWNFTPVLLAMLYGWPRVRERPALLAALLLGWGAIELQSSLDIARGSVYRGTPALAWLSSVALYGTLLITALVAWLLVEPALAKPAPTPSTAPL
jgi:uncharacterized membrane protein YhaH (DUF805 family)